MYAHVICAIMLICSSQLTACTRLEVERHEKSFNNLDGLDILDAADITTTTTTQPTTTTTTTQRATGICSSKTFRELDDVESFSFFPPNPRRLFPNPLFR
ncbi:hypothetical protein EG68_09220 [Paragonimus skrjabini miyazakii]|uniref:Uncharacterized protein n=1 Tax=Paragonimus skrjabini miyazakii TaxID=59628 RepID=A0A8S9YDU3_9TREM|nr:hypothetical protein EG68_09220 [Paragonimus skrjabini miyazakii]